MVIMRKQRELSNTSLAADSGIGQDGISFAESLTTEIMTTAVTNAGHAVSRYVSNFLSSLVIEWRVNFALYVLGSVHKNSTYFHPNLTEVFSVAFVCSFMSCAWFSYEIFVSRFLLWVIIHLQGWKMRENTITSTKKQVIRIKEMGEFYSRV